MGAELLAAGVVAFALTSLIHSTLLLVGAWLLSSHRPALKPSPAPTMSAAARFMAITRHAASMKRTPKLRWSRTSMAPDPALCTSKRRRWSPIAR